MNDVVVLQLGGELRFVDEHGDEVDAVGERGQDLLDRHRLLEALDSLHARLPDLGHAAGGDAAHQGVLAELARTVRRRGPHGLDALGAEVVARPTRARLGAGLGGGLDQLIEPGEIEILALELAAAGAGLVGRRRRDLLEQLLRRPHRLRRPVAGRRLGHRCGGRRRVGGRAQHRRRAGGRDLRGFGLGRLRRGRLGLLWRLDLRRGGCFGRRRLCGRRRGGDRPRRDNGRRCRGLALRQIQSGQAARQQGIDVARRSRLLSGSGGGLVQHAGESLLRVSSPRRWTASGQPVPGAAQPVPGAAQRARSRLPRACPRKAPAR